MPGNQHPILDTEPHNESLARAALDRIVSLRLQAPADVVSLASRADMVELADTLL
jgi:hypothetical protein